MFLTDLADDWDLTDQPQKAVIKLVPAEGEEAEARAAAWEAATTLSHPNLMKVYTHGRCEIDDVPCLYVVTEFADEVLAEILFERPLITKETGDMLGPALDALRYLHANGLVHGRLNPSNIMAAGDSLKLTTYSVCSVGATVTSSSTRTVCDAPETEYGPIRPASDIWSLGATLVEVLTKYPPQWNRAKTAEPTVPESMPEPFASIARKCLRSDPARRITLDEIAARLDPAKAPSRISREAGIRFASPSSYRAPARNCGSSSGGSRNLVRAFAPSAAGFACSASSESPGCSTGTGASTGARCNAVCDRYPGRNRNHNSRANHAAGVNNCYASGLTKLRFRPPAQPQCLQPFRRLKPPIKPQRPPRRRTISLPLPQP